MSKLNESNEKPIAEMSVKTLRARSEASISVTREIEVDKNAAQLKETSACTTPSVRMPRAIGKPLGTN